MQTPTGYKLDPIILMGAKGVWPSVEQSGLTTSFRPQHGSMWPKPRSETLPLHAQGPPRSTELRSQLSWMFLSVER